MWIISLVISEMPIFHLSKDSVIQVLIRWVLTGVPGVCGGGDLPKEYQSFSVGSQKPQVSHFHELAWIWACVPECCLAGWTFSVLAPEWNAAFSTFLRRQTQLVKLWHCHGQSLLTPSSFFKPRLALHWERGCSTNMSSETRAPGICFRDRTRTLLLTCSLSWELQQRPQTTVVAIKVVF